MSDPDNPYSSASGAGNYQMSYKSESEQSGSDGRPQMGDAPSADKPAGMGASGISGISGMGGTGAAAPVMNISNDQFVTEVIEASKSMPVLIDFWAPWCGPCKQLTPVLEKIAAEYSGQVKLVKMDTEQFPEIAGQMGIQSIPAVVVFIDGKPVDAFMGAKPESEIRKFFEKHAGPAKGMDIGMVVAEARQLVAANDLPGATDLLVKVLQSDPENSAALALLGSIYLKNDDNEKAENIFNSINPDQHDNPDVAALKSALELLKQADELDDLQQLVDAVKADPVDFQAKFDLSLAYNIAGDRDKAADMLLEIIKSDREWMEDGARKQLIKYFESWGEADDTTKSGRRKLSTALFS